MITEKDNPYRMVFDHAEALISVYDRLGICQLMNKKLAKLFGGSPADFVGKSITQLHTEMGQEYARRIRRAIETDRSKDYEDEVAFPEGNRWLLSKVHPIYDSRNDDSVAQIISQDITERRQAEEALRASEARFRALFNTMTQGVVYQDAEGKIISANPSAEKILGLSIDQMQGRTSVDPRWKSIHEDGTEFPGETHPSMIALKTGRVVKDVMMGVYNPQNETLRWLKINAVPQFMEGESKPYQVYATFEDITGRKHAEDALRESEERFRALFDNAPLPYQSLDENGHFLEVNRRWLELLGYGRDEVVGKSFAAFLHPDWTDHFKENFPKFKTIGEVLGVEFELRKKDGSFIWVSFDGKIRRDNKGGFIQTHCVFNDITEQRRLEKSLKEKEIALRHAKKMESVGTLAGGIAHDFNNILSIIIGNNELIADETPEWSPLRDNIAEIRAAGLRARDIVRQLLTFSSQSDAKKQPLDIGSVVRDSHKLIRTTMPATIGLDVSVADDLDVILGNATQVYQVLFNLCSNAKDAVAASDGRIDIRLTNVNLDDASAVVPPSLSHGRYVKLTVRDNGCGIDESNLDKIFDPYFTTKEIGEGSGIGLSVTHGIVEKHNGAIFVESQPDEGTAFSIYFPSYRGQIEKPPEAKVDLPSGAERILFVDDEVSLMKLGKHRLEKLGYEVTATTDPEEAFELFKRDPTQFDLVVTDMAMPKLTGDRLSKRILEIQPDTPIILCTGYSENISEQMALEFGIRSFMTKPLDREDMATTVRKLLDEAKK